VTYPSVRSRAAGPLNLTRTHKEPAGAIRRAKLDLRFVSGPAKARDNAISCRLRLPSINDLLLIHHDESDIKALRKGPLLYDPTFLSLHYNPSRTERWMDKNTGRQRSNHFQLFVKDVSHWAAATQGAIKFNVL